MGPEPASHAGETPGQKVTCGTLTGVKLSPELISKVCVNGPHTTPIWYTTNCVSYLQDPDHGESLIFIIIVIIFTLLLRSSGC